MNVKTVKESMQYWADHNREEFYEAAEGIWKAAELSMQEHVSSEILIRLLEKNDFSVEKGVAGMPTAFIATFGKGKPVIGINAEYDALPGLSQDPDQVRKSPLQQNAPGHGCGHNLLGAASVKAAIALSKTITEQNLSGTIKIFGAPAEELCLGKPFLGKAGCLRGVDAFLDWHPWSYNRADYDSCCAYFSVKYHYTGKTAHGNSPWHGRSTLDAAMLQAHATELLREHIYPGCPPDAANTFNYTISDAGPEFPSVVPDHTTIWYVGRFVTSEDAQDSLRRITNCAKGAALSTETEVEVELITATNHKIPNKVLAQLMHDNLQEMGAPAFTEDEQAVAREIQKQIGVAETGLDTAIQDFAGGYSVVCDTPEYSWNAPYATAWVTLAPENTGWHHWGITLCANSSIGRKCMDQGAKIIAATGIDLLLAPDKVEEAKAELSERLGGKRYRNLLPEEYQPPVHMNQEIMKKYSQVLEG